MPELPEVETIKNGISAIIGKAEIADVVVRNRSFREPVPADFAKQIVGSRIVDYGRIGKYIVIRLDNGKDILWHLGMSGKIKTCDKLPDTLAKHDHVIITTDRGCMIFNDPRRFGLILTINDSELKQHHCLRNMGPDPFDKNLDGKYLYQRLQKCKTPIKIALLNQKIINGIGNIYASEILYRARISPLRRADSVSADEAENLVAQTRVVLSAAIANGGSTLHDYQRPDGSLGYFQNLHCVYNKTGQRCPDCCCDFGTTGGIKKIVQGGRSTFYCPTLQK